MPFPDEPTHHPDLEKVCIDPVLSEETKSFNGVVHNIVESWANFGTITWEVHVKAKTGSVYPIEDVTVAENLGQGQYHVQNSYDSMVGVVDIRKATLRTVSGDILTPGADYTLDLSDANNPKFHFDVLNEEVIITLKAEFPIPISGEYAMLNVATVTHPGSDSVTDQVGLTGNNTDILVEKSGVVNPETRIVTWTVVLNPDKQPMNPDADKVLFTDLLPDGFELRNYNNPTDPNATPSIHVAYEGYENYGYWNTNGVDFNAIQDGNTIEQIDITPYEKKTIGHQLDHAPWYEAEIVYEPYTAFDHEMYTVTYKTYFNDAAWAEVTSSETGTASFTNTAIFTDGDKNTFSKEADVEITAEDFLTKKDMSSEEMQDRDLIYLIDVNPKGYTLNRGEPLQLSDEISTAVDLRTSEVRVYRVDDEIVEPSTDIGSEDTLGVPFNDVEISYNDDTRVLLISGIPDNQHFRVVLVCRVRNLTADPETFTNTATLIGGGTHSVTVEGQHTVEDLSASATGALSLHKIDENDISKGLQGAEFELYHCDTDIVYDEATGTATGGVITGVMQLTAGSDNGRYISDEDGVVHFGSASNGVTFVPDNLYYWVEKVAPTGYAAVLNVPHYFTIVYEDNNTDEVGVSEANAAARAKAKVLDHAWQDANGIIVNTIDGQNTWTATNSKYRSITASKAWAGDYDDQYGTRPEKVTLTLIQIDGSGNEVEYHAEGVQNPITLTKDATKGWAQYTTYTWQKLPVYDDDGKEYKYTVVEDVVQNYFAEYSDNGEGITTGKLEITNKLIPSKTNVSVRKVWVDADTHPEQIVVNLKQITTDPDGNISDPEDPDISGVTRQVILNAENEWTYTWNDLPARGADGNYSYTVEEETVDGYTTVYSDRQKGVLDGTITITNTKPGGLKIVKNVTVNGQSTDTNKADGTYTFTVKDSDGETVGTASITIEGGVSNYAVVNNLDAGTYTVTEDEPENGAILMTDNNVVVTVAAGVDGEDAAATGTAAFTNDMELGNLEVRKTIAPAGLNVDKSKISFTVTGPNSFSETFTLAEMTDGVKLLEDLPLGEYTVVETRTDGDAPSGYAWKSTTYQVDEGETTQTSATATVSSNGGTVVKVENEYELSTGKIVVDKSWGGVADASDLEAMKAGFTLTVTGVDAGGSGVNTRTFSFSELPATIDGLPLNETYSITESNMATDVLAQYEVVSTSTTDHFDGATPGVDGTTYTLVNTYEPKPGSLKITKTLNINGAAVTDGNKNLADGTYTFEIWNSDGTAQVTQKADGTAIGTLSITITDGVANPAELTVEGMTAGDYIVVETTPTDGSTLTGSSGGTTATADGLSGQKVTVTKGDFTTVPTVAFTNNKDFGDLIVEKKVSGRKDATNSFTFEISLTNANVSVDGEYPATKTTADGEQDTTVTFTGGKASVSLKADEKIQVKNLSAGTTYTVTETGTLPDGYSEGTHEGDSGSIAKSPTAKATMNNEYDTDTEISIPGTKELTGRTPGDGDFSFNIEAVTANAPTPTATKVSNTGTGFTFGPIKYDLDDFKAVNDHKYVYKITEDQTGVNATTHVKDNILYDQTEIEVTVMLSYDENTGVLSATVDKNAETVKFINTPQTTTVNADKSWLNVNDEDAKDTLPTGAKAKFGAFRDGASDPMVQFEMDGTVDTEPTGDDPAAYEDAAWHVTFKNLPKYKVDGSAESVYVVKEIEVTGVYGFVNQNTDGVANGGTIANRQEDTQVPVSKVWKKNDGTTAAWPTDSTLESITVKLKAGEDEVATQTLTKDEPSYTFEKLPKVDMTTGVAIVYTVDEVSVEGYISGITGDGTNGYVITNTPDKTNVTVTKDWADSDTVTHDNDWVKVKLYRDGADAGLEEVTLNKDTTPAAWSKTWDNLPAVDDVTGKKYVYAVVETDYHAENGLTYNSDSSADSPKAMTADGKNWTVTINNTPGDTVDVEATKTWTGDKWPKNVVVVFTLKQNDAVYRDPVNVDADTEGHKAKWEKLPKTDSNGTDYVYTVEETVKIGAKTLTAEDFTAGTVTKVNNEDYKWTVNNDMTTVDVPVRKTWANGTPYATAVRFELQTSDGTKVTEDAYGDAITNPVVLNAANSWTDSTSFVKLPKLDANGDAIAYQVVETGVLFEGDPADEANWKDPDDYFTVGDSEAYNETGFKINNTPDKITFNVEKQWFNGTTEITELIQNATASVKLTDGTNDVKVDADGEPFTAESPVTVDENGVVTLTGGTWTYTWKNLNKYDKQGNEIQYVLEETEAKVGDDTLTLNKVSTIEGNLVKNTLPTIEIPVLKAWSEGVEPKAGDYVEFTLYDSTGTTPINRPGTETPYVLHIEYDEVNSKWPTDAVNFTNLPMYDNTGAAITYKVVETKVKLGESELTDPQTIKTVYTANDGTVISNGDIETVTITNNVGSKNYKVKKIWGEGQEPPEGAVIVFTLSGTSGEPAASVDLTALDVKTTATLDGGKTGDDTTTEWEYEWKGLPEYDKAGKAITYSAAETSYTIDREQYIEKLTHTSNTEVEGYDLVETNDLPKTKIKAEKQWPAEQEVPAGTQVTLTISATVSDGNDGTAAPKGVTIATASVTLDGQVSQDEGEVETADTKWQYTWEELPQYDKDGKKITYAVTETAYTIAGVDASKLEALMNEANGGITSEEIEGGKAYTILNDLPKTDQHAVKDWVGTPKDSVTFTLKAVDSNDDAVELSTYGVTAEMTVMNDDDPDKAWRADWNDLPMFTKDGLLIGYSVIEATVEGYRTTYEKNGDTTTVTNTELTEAEAEKKWKGSVEEEKITSITFQLTRTVDGATGEAAAPDTEFNARPENTVTITTISPKTTVFGLIFYLYRTK